MNSIPKINENAKSCKNLCRFCGAKDFETLDKSLDEDILVVIEKLFSFSAENLFFFKICIDCLSFIELISTFCNQVKNLSETFEKQNLCHSAEQKGNTDPEHADEDTSETIMMKIFEELENEDNVSDAQICSSNSKGVLSDYLAYENVEKESEKKINHSNKRTNRASNKTCECESCGKKFLNNNHLTEHRKLCCPLETNSPFNHSETAKNKISSISKQYECKTCGKEFSSNGALKEHTKLHLPVEEKRVSFFKCPHCDMTYPRKDSMLNHVRSKHSKEKPFVCKICNKEFSSPNNLYGHQKYNHDKNIEKPCPICQKIFTPFRMEKHLKNHQEANILCTICGDLLKSKYNLKRHMLIHSGTKAYKCNYCGKDFRLRETLKLHMITHTDLKPFACRFCSCSFVQLSSCKEHEKKRHKKEHQKKVKDNKTYCSEVSVKLPSIKQLHEMLENLKQVEEI